jgi:hypothetical protein
MDRVRACRWRTPNSCDANAMPRAVAITQQKSADERRIVAFLSTIQARLITVAQKSHVLLDS